MVSERPTRAPAFLRARKLQAELGALSAAAGMGLACRGGGGEANAAMAPPGGETGLDVCELSVIVVFISAGASSAF